MTKFIRLVNVFGFCVSSAISAANAKPPSAIDGIPTSSETIQMATCLAQGSPNPVPPCTDDITLLGQAALYTANIAITHFSDSGRCIAKLQIIKSITGETLTLGQAATSSMGTGDGVFDNTTVFEFPKPLLLDANDKIRIETQKLGALNLAVRGPFTL